MSNATMQHAPADVRERVAKIVREAMEDARRSERLNTFLQSSMWDYADRILALLHTPRGEGERVKGAWATVEAAALAQANLLDSNFAGQSSKAAEIRNAVEQVAALLRTPRGEAEALAVEVIRLNTALALLKTEENAAHVEAVATNAAWLEELERIAAFATRTPTLRLDAALCSEAQGDAEALAALVVRIWTRCQNEGPHYRETDEFWLDFERAYQLAARRDGAQGSEASAPYAYIGVEETWDADSRSVTVYERVLWDRDSATRWQAERPEDRTVTPVYHRPAARRGEGGE